METSKTKKINLEEFKNRIVTVHFKFKTHKASVSGIIIKMDEEKFFVCDSEDPSYLYVTINGRDFRKIIHFNCCLKSFNPISIKEIIDIELCHAYHLSEKEDIEVILEDLKKYFPLLFHLYKGKDNIKTCQDCKNFDLVEFKCKVKNHFKPNQIACSDFK